MPFDWGCSGAACRADGMAAAAGGGTLFHCTWLPSLPQAPPPCCSSLPIISGRIRGAAHLRMEGELVLLGLNQAPSFNAVLKALKREESTVHNCVASIADDALFVQQVRPDRGLTRLREGRYVAARWRKRRRVAVGLQVMLGCIHTVTTASHQAPPHRIRSQRDTPVCRSSPTCAAACGTCGRPSPTLATSSRRTGTTATGASPQVGEMGGLGFGKQGGGSQHREHSHSSSSSDKLSGCSCPCCSAPQPECGPGGGSSRRLPHRRCHQAGKGGWVVCVC